MRLQLKASRQNTYTREKSGKRITTRKKEIDQGEDKKERMRDRAREEKNGIEESTGSKSNCLSVFFLYFSALINKNSFSFLTGYHFSLLLLLVLVLNSTQALYCNQVDEERRRRISDWLTDSFFLSGRFMIG